MSLTATIDQLRPGANYPDGNINARLHYTDAEIEELAASLKGPDGQLRPLLVATHPKKPSTFFVFGGGRRRLAFERLISRGDLQKDHAIEIKDHGHVAVATALSMSFADNQAVPMHPADQAATFAKLAADRSPEEIAAERGMTVKAVNQFIALGTTLADEIIADWRSGVLSREAVETFTTAESKEAQLAAYAWTKEQWSWKNNKHIQVTELRRRIMKNKEPVMKRLLGFVGADAYRAAGGTLTADFFGDGGFVHDMRLLNKLAKGKMDTLVALQIADGWSWAEGKMALSHMHHGFGELATKAKLTAAETARVAEIDKLAEAADEESDYDKVEQLEDEKEAIEAAARARAFTATDKAKAGIILSLDNDGRVHFQAGLIKRAETKKSAPEARATKREEPPLDWNVRNKLEEWRNQAARFALAKHPVSAVALFLASCGRGWNQRTVINSGRADEVAAPGSAGKTVDAAFKYFSALPAESLVAQMGAVAAGCVDFEDIDGESAELLQPIAAITGVDVLQDALRSQFKAKEYVAGATKQHLLGVFREADGEAARKAAEGETVEAMRKKLGTSLADTGWLPPELRTAAYVGPGSKAADKKAKAKALGDAKAAEKKAGKKAAKGRAKR